MSDIKFWCKRVKRYNPGTFGYDNYIGVSLWNDDNSKRDDVCYSFSELRQKSPMLLDYYLQECVEPEGDATPDYRYDRPYIIYDCPDEKTHQSRRYDICPVLLDEATFEGTKCINISGFSSYYPYMERNPFYWNDDKNRIPSMLQKLIGQAMPKPYYLGYGTNRRNSDSYGFLESYGENVILMHYREEEDPYLYVDGGVDGAEFYHVDLRYYLDAEFTKEDDFDYEFKFDYCGNYNRYTLTDMLDETINDFFHNRLGFRGIKYAPGKIIDHMEYLDDLNKCVYNLLAPYGYRDFGIL